MWFLPIIILFLPNITTLTRSIASRIFRRGVIVARKKFQILFSRLIILNLAGLIPFRFPLTSLGWLAIITAIRLWFYVLYFQYRIIFAEMIAHLAPAGAPAALAPFLVIIERVSIVIRPLTLTVRLVANITVGHVVCALIRVILSSFSSVWSISIIIFFYSMFEFAIAVIQAYIFTLLLTLYAEVSPPSIFNAACC